MPVVRTNYFGVALHRSPSPPGAGDDGAGRIGPEIRELARATGLSIRAMQVALIELALAGRIERHGHQLVSLAPGGMGSDPAS